MEIDPEFSEGDEEMLSLSLLEELAKEIALKISHLFWSLYYLLTMIIIRFSLRYFLM